MGEDRLFCQFLREWLEGKNDSFAYHTSAWHLVTIWMLSQPQGDCDAHTSFCYEPPHRCWGTFQFLLPDARNHVDTQLFPFGVTTFKDLIAFNIRVANEEEIKANLVEMDGVADAGNKGFKGPVASVLQPHQAQQLRKAGMWADRACQRCCS